MSSGMDEEQLAALAQELAELSQKQAQAGQLAIYVSMSREELAVYDKRRERIIEICIMLAKYHPI